MTGVKTEVKTFAASRELRERAARAQDVKPALRRIVVYLYGAEEAQFASRGARSGDPWKTVRPATRRIKRQQRLDPRPMRGTGELQESLTRRGPMQRRIVRKTSLRLGTRSKAAQFTQGRRNGRRQAERIIMAVTAADEAVAVEAIENEIMGRRP